jgi:hypothetical protein
MIGIVDQPPPSHRPDHVPVWDFVIADFKRIYDVDWQDGDEEDPVAIHVVADMYDRDRLGRERYGMPLTARNGRDQVVDAYQEMLDGAAYLRAALAEGVQVRSLYYTQLQLILETRRILDARSPK